MSVTSATPSREKRKRESKPVGKKVTVVLPDELIVRLNDLVPARHRSKFISGAITEKIELAEQVAILDETVGGWSQENHPDLTSPENVEQWIREFRSQWTIPLVES